MYDFHMAAACCSHGTVVMAPSAALRRWLTGSKRLAQLRCAACHIIAPTPEVGETPPFEVIGPKFGFNADATCICAGRATSQDEFWTDRTQCDMAAYIVTLPNDLLRCSLALYRQCVCERPLRLLTALQCRRD